MLSRDWLNAFVPIGLLRSPTEWGPIGAGVLLHDPPVIWLVTAAHVVRAAHGGELAPLVTRGQGGLTVVKLGDIQREHGYQWHFDDKRDIAATLMPLSSDWRVKAIDERLCIKTADLLPSMQCYTVGCPYGVRGFDPQRSTPLVLDGVIAGVDPSSGTLYTSVPTFPGNSGGPIIVRREPFSHGGGVVVGQPVVLLAGIILQARLVSSENPAASAQLPPLHLGIGISVEAALGLIKSAGVQDERNKVLARTDRA